MLNLWWKILVVHIFVFSLATNFHVTSALPMPTNNSSTELIETLIKAIGKAAEFFKDSYKDINVDGLFGLQVGEGQLKESARRLTTTRWLNTSESWRNQLQKIITKMSDVLNLTLDNNLAKDNAYTEEFLRLLKQPFHFERQAQQIGISYNSPPHHIDQNLVYDENFGDNCLARVLGSYIENNRTLPKCTVTKDCLTYMMAPLTSGYYLTHQLLYFIFIQKIGCEGTGLLSQFSERPTIRDLERDFCRRIYQEAQLLTKQKNMDAADQDLFTEQTLLCAPLGFLDFIRTDWMKLVLSMQDPSGCFTDKTTLNIKESARSTSTMRKLMREKFMKGGCLSHKSGLGYGVLTIYLNSLIQDRETNGY